MSKYDFEEWLSGHATRKTLMEKLERSLVPYDLFALIPMKNDEVMLEGDIEYNTNTYHYMVSYDYDCFNHKVYDATLQATQVNDYWNNPLLGYCNFKVVMEEDRILTIYPYHDDFFQQILEMFEEEDLAGLFVKRSVYVNSMLARYILLRLIRVYNPQMQLLTTIDTAGFGRLSVMATNANRTAIILYAFSKRDAVKMAMHYDGICPKLTVVYFFNQDFERDGNTGDYKTSCTQVVSIRAFYNELPLSDTSKLLTERRVLLLVSLLYNEHLLWEYDRIAPITINPPYYGKKAKEFKESMKEHLKQQKKNKTNNIGQPWWERIPRTLLEDALNVITVVPRSQSDIFHFLCAANLVNAYINQCNKQKVHSPSRIKRMFLAKQQIFHGVECMIKNPNVQLSLEYGRLPSLHADIRMEGHDYQFSFRGMKAEEMASLLNKGLSINGHFKGFSMQSIATALYQYSYLLRWKDSC